MAVEVTLVIRFEHRLSRRVLEEHITDEFEDATIIEYEVEEDV